jgi:hypothetical protein
VPRGLLATYSWIMEELREDFTVTSAIAKAKIVRLVQRYPLLSRRSFT